MTRPMLASLSPQRGLSETLTTFKFPFLPPLNKQSSKVTINGSSLTQSDIFCRRLHQIGTMQPAVAPRIQRVRGSRRSRNCQCLRFEPAHHGAKTEECITVKLIWKCSGSTPRHLSLISLVRLKRVERHLSLSVC